MSDVKKPPRVIWLQFHGDVSKFDMECAEREGRGVSPGDVTWCQDKIHDTDVRYIIDKRTRKSLTPTTHEGTR